MLPRHPPFPCRKDSRLGRGRVTDFTAITQARLDDIARKLNTRPRRTLDYATPAEALSDLLAVATTT